MKLNGYLCETANNRCKQTRAMSAYRITIKRLGGPSLLATSGRTCPSARSLSLFRSILSQSRPLQPLVAGRRLKSTMAEQRKIWQPLGPSIRSKLDPEYVAFHDEFAQYIQPDDSKPWDPEIRTGPRLPYSGIGPAKVGKTEDAKLGELAMRVFTPEGTHGGAGWPLLVWFHGGGFVGGDIDSDVDFLTRACSSTQSLVFSSRLCWH